MRIRVVCERTGKYNDPCRNKIDERGTDGYNNYTKDVGVHYETSTVPEELKTLITEYRN